MFAFPCCSSVPDNDRVLIWFLVILILLTAVALSFVLYKIYILQRKKTQ
jgi:hypothetical protein